MLISGTYSEQPMVTLYSGMYLSNEDQSRDHSRDCKNVVSSNKWCILTGELVTIALVGLWKGGLLAQVILTLTVLVTTIDALRHFKTG